MEVEDVIWNNSFNYSFLRFYMDFELFQRFQVKGWFAQICAHLA
jgi:hypothetical protein